MAGYEWLGMDISHSMLSVAVERNVDGDLFQSDIGDGLPFREGCFDAAISISTLQWLTHCDTSSTKPKQRLAALFNSLFKCLKRGSRAVFQLYPTDSTQLELISECAMKAGFVFSLIVDFPNSSKAKKFYIVLDCGSVKRRIPKAQTVEDSKKQMFAHLASSEHNEEATIKMQQGMDSIQCQAKKSTFVHGDKRSKNKKIPKRQKNGGQVSRQRLDHCAKGAPAKSVWPRRSAKRFQIYWTKKETDILILQCVQGRICKLNY